MSAQTFPSPSKDYRHGKGNTFEWKLNSQWRRFRIKAHDADVENPEALNLIGRVILEDHTEELHQLGDQFFRYAGGGRGFYWWDELELIEEEPHSASQMRDYDVNLT